MDLGLSENIVDSQTVVEVRGDVDIHTAPQLRDRLIDVLTGGGKSVIVDLTSLTFMDSTGLGALVAARTHAEETNATLRIVCPSERLLKLFRITGLDRVFAIYASVPLAVAAGSLPSAAS